MRILLAGAGFSASVAFALAAGVPPNVERGWYLNGHWAVSGIAFADGHKDCVVANTQPTSRGKSAFVLSEFSDGGSTIIVRATTVTWDASRASLTFQIDGNSLFTAEAQTDKTHNVLVVGLNGTPSTIMSAFMNQPVSGRLLLVTPGAGTPRTFALDGVQPALDGVQPALEAFGRCVAEMSSGDDRGP